MHLKVLARHLHPMADPGHRAGVTTGSSTQPGESVQLLTPRNTLNYYGQKQRRSHLSHSNAPNAEQQLLLKNVVLESFAIQQLKTEEIILKDSN